MGINKVYLIGAGPGHPGLITVRGREILRQADVVIYDYLVGKRLLEGTKEHAELICCDKLRGKKYSDKFLIHQEKINNLIVKKAKEGRKVVRLKNGDPSIFSRLSQELEVLVKNKIEFEIVPGVTAASAACCLNGIPLTDRQFASSCIFVTGHEDPRKGKSFIDTSTALIPAVHDGDWRTAQYQPRASEVRRGVDWNKAAGSGTIVLYMAAENLPQIVKKLTAAGKAGGTPVAIIQQASLMTQKAVIGTLGDIEKKAKEKKIKPPAIIIIGETAGFEKRFNWLRKNRRILFTGLSDERFFEKGTYFHLPLIKIEPLQDYKEFDNHLRGIGRFDWIVFASRYGVEYFFKRLKAVGLDARALSGIKIAAVGNSTKNLLLASGIIADLVPKKESSEGLISEFRELKIRGSAFFLPRSDISDKGLKKALERLGAEVVESFAYRNVMPDDLADLDLNFFDEIMFTSPSTVRNFKKRYKYVPKTVRIRCIGDVTLKEAKKWHLRG